MIRLLAQSDETGVLDTLRSAAELLTTPAGVASSLIFIALFLFCVISRYGWQILVGLLLLLSTLSEGSNEWFDNTLFPPLEQVRSASQFLVVGLVGSIFLITRGKPWDGASRIAGGAIVALFIFELFYGFRLTLSGQYTRGGLGMITYSLLFLAWPIGIGRIVSERGMLDRLIATYSLVALPYVILNFLQYTYSPANTIVSSRFAGISGNPQHTGMMCALLSVTGIWILSRPRSNRWIFPLTIASVAGTLLILAWTGSRTSILSAFFGLMILFRKRALALLFIGGVVGLLAMLVAPMFSEGQDAFERLSSTDNTRLDVWIDALAEFRGDPLFGTLGINHVGEQKVVESTPLQTMQTMGLSGLLFLVVVYALVAFSVLSLQRARRKAPSLAHQVDYAMAIWTMLMIMSITEAVLLGIVTFFNMTFYFVAVVTARLLGEASASEEPWLDGESDEGGQEWAILPG